jgi:hypothetical protein
MTLVGFDSSVGLAEAKFLQLQMQTVGLVMLAIE